MFGLRLCFTMENSKYFNKSTAIREALEESMSEVDADEDSEEILRPTRKGRKRNASSRYFEYSTIQQKSCAQ